MFTTCFLDALTQPFGIRHHHYGFWLLFVLFPELLVPLLLLFLAWSWVLTFTLLRAHTGYLNFVRALNRWCSSCYDSWGIEHIVLALWCRVPTTLYLDDIVWWLSHCKYESVWVGFLYTVFWDCHLLLVSPEYLRRVQNHLFWNLHWRIEYSDLWSWNDPGSFFCELF